MLMIVAPACAVVLGFVAALLASAANLRSSLTEAENAWKELQAARGSLLTFLSSSTIGQHLNQEIERCHKAETPAKAALADDALIAKAAPLTASELALRQDLERLDGEIGSKRRLYNSIATVHNNACVTFPAILIAKRLGYKELETYRTAIAAGSGLDRERATQLNLSDDTKVMNAYMLWAVAWGGSTDIEEVPRKTSSAAS